MVIFSILKNILSMFSSVNVEWPITLIAHFFFNVCICIIKDLGFQGKKCVSNSSWNNHVSQRISAQYRSYKLEKNLLETLNVESSLPQNPEFSLNNSDSKGLGNQSLIELTCLPFACKLPFLQIFIGPISPVNISLVGSTAE